MSFVACGLSYKTAPVSVREQFYFPKEKIGLSLLSLKKSVLVNDAVILSTCNRTEIYCSSVSNPTSLSNWLADYHGLSPDVLLPHLYVYQGEESVKHVFRVASGMDSMILGEPQIFGQLKEAVSTAEKTGTLNGALRKFFHHAFSVGKKIRTETTIGTNALSLGKVITQLIKANVRDEARASVLILGAGEVVDSLVDELKKMTFEKITIANRTLHHAKKIAEKLGASVCKLGETDLASADIVISAVGSETPVIEKNAVVLSMKQRKQKPILFFDLGVPRNISSEIRKLKNTTLFSFDDVNEILEKNKTARLQSVSAAESVIDEQTKKFMLSLRSRSVAEAVKKYRQKMALVRDDYLEQSLQALRLGECPEKVIEKLSHQLTNKFLHAPSVNLKKAACQEDWVLIHAIEKLWDI